MCVYTVAFLQIAWEYGGNERELHTIGEIGFVGGSLYNGFICLFIYFPTKKVVFLGYQFLRILKFVH